RILQEAYGEHAPSQDTCERWFKLFKSDDFDVKNKECPSQPKKFEDQQLQALLDEDVCQTQNQLAERLNVAQQTISNCLQAMGKILKEGKWVPHQLNERQMENQKVISKMLLQQHERKSFLHQIVTGDENWIYFENPKCTKSWVDLGQPSTLTARPNRFGKKTMLCVSWDQEGAVYYELLKPGETVNTDYYQNNETTRMCQKTRKVILLHDNASSHISQPVKDTLKDLAWEVPPDLAPSNYHLFRRWHTHFLSSTSKQQEKFYWDSIHKLPERWGKCVASDGHYFE
uniref:Mos1 transposase HTH domain-containing protein n=1 Tax=Myotis lucifugus TaxID=59463 RepID=G1Q736_MYOLU